MIDTLTALRDGLAGIAGVASCEIGIEADIAASYWPIIRIVPTRISPGRPYGNRTAEVLIYFGDDTTNSEGMAQVYTTLFALEAGILAGLRTLGHRYLETVADEDRFAAAYKLMVVRCEVGGDS